MSEKDNTELKPAEENPWYVLATICDKWDEDDDEKFIVNDKVLTNCEVWNSWVIPSLSEKTISAIGKSQSTGFPGPKWIAIKHEVEARFKRRTSGGELPDLSKEINLRDTTFSKEADFGCFYFPTNVGFDRSIFVKNVSFKNTFFAGTISNLDTIFFGKTFFHLATFCSYARFRNVIFFEDVTFAHTVFEYYSHLEGSKFERQSNFRNCQFNKACNLRRVKFKKEYPLLEGSKFDEKSTVTAKKEYWPSPQNCEQNPEEAKATCEILREQMEAQGLHEQAHFFFRREMHFAGKMLSPWQRLPNNLFACLSAYGFSLKRPLGALALLWALPMLIFWVNICTGKCANTIGAELWVSLIKMAGLSIANIFQITGLQRVYWSDFIECLPWGLKFLGGLQTLLAIPLLFLLLLGLRNRFRLK